MLHLYGDAYSSIYCGGSFYIRRYTKRTYLTLFSLKLDRVPWNPAWNQNSYSVVYNAGRLAEFLRHRCGRSGVRLPGRSNWTQCVHRLITDRRDVFSELCCPGAKPCRWAPPLVSYTLGRNTASTYSKDFDWMKWILFRIW